MNLDTPEGAKVIFIGKGGYSNDVSNAIKAGLEIGKEYTVSHIDVSQSSSRVTLQEFKGSFNTVMFENSSDYEEGTDWWGHSYV